MIHEDLELKGKYFDLSAEIINWLDQRSLLKKEKLVVGICGESGSGKSVTAKCLQIALEQRQVPALVLHQDSYYKLPPKENQDKRKADLNWVGPNEVNMTLLQAHINDFKAGKEQIAVPVLDYEKNQFSEHRISIQDKTVLIVEGVYAFFLQHFDSKIFMERTYKDTLEKRAARTREVYDPFVEEVLAIEHAIISPLKQQADVMVLKDYALSVNR